MGLLSLITGQNDDTGLDLSSILRRKETLRQEGGRQPTAPAAPPTGALAGAPEEDIGPLATYRRQALANQASLMKAYGARQEASKGILEQLSQNKGNKNSEMWFQLAAALGKPTTTGSFGETIGNVGEAMASSAATRNKAAQAQRELQAKYALGMLDTDVDIAKAQYAGATDIEKAILTAQTKNSANIGKTDWQQLRRGLARQLYPDLKTDAELDAANALYDPRINTAIAKLMQSTSPGSTELDISALPSDLFSGEDDLDGVDDAALNAELERRGLL